MNKLVSIITPTFNVEKFISQTIESVLNQTYPHWELLITDDASTDHTVKIIEGYQKKDPRIKLFKLNQNSGAAVARNTSIENAKGKYHAFLDGDDIWFINHLQDSVSTLHKLNMEFVFASYQRSDENLNIVYKPFIVPKSVTYADILKTNSISCLTAVVDVETLGKKLMPTIGKRHDMLLWLSYLEMCKTAYGIQKCHAIYRIRKKSLSRNKLNVLKYQWEMYRQYLKFNVFKSTYYMCCWVFKGIKKYT